MKKILAMLLALVLCFSMVACGGSAEEPEESAAPETETAAPAEGEETAEPAEGEEAEEPAEGEEAAPAVMSYEEFVAAPIDSEVTVETYVQAKQGWWEDKATVYTADEDGAYFLYELPCTEAEYETLVEGQKIRVTGFKAEWSGEVEIIDATWELLEGDSYVAEPVDVTELLGTDALAEKMNQKVSFKGMTVASEAMYKYDGSGELGDDLYFDVTLGDKTYTFTVESYLCGADTEVYKAVDELKVGDVVDMEGFLYWYEGANPHITAVAAAE